MTDRLAEIEVFYDGENRCVLGSDDFQWLIAELKATRTARDCAQQDFVYVSKQWNDAVHELTDARDEVERLRAENEAEHETTRHAVDHAKTVLSLLDLERAAVGRLRATLQEIADGVCAGEEYGCDRYCVELANETLLPKSEASDDT